MFVCRWFPLLQAAACVCVLGLLQPLCALLLALVLCPLCSLALLVGQYTSLPQVKLQINTLSVAVLFLDNRLQKEEVVN